MQQYSSAGRITCLHFDLHERLSGFVPMCDDFYSVSQLQGAEVYFRELLPFLGNSRPAYLIQIDSAV